MAHNLFLLPAKARMAKNAMEDIKRIGGVWRHWRETYNPAP
ncbi:hypothetical protein [Acidocella aminolytica]|nr:hypothetical protein [Acidocella aminolytica]